jgi:hypothetical protein
MRNIVLVVLSLLIMGSAAYAQTEKGNLLLGGHGYVKARTPQNAIRQTNVVLSPRIGYFVAPGVAVGATLPVSYTTYKGVGSLYSVGASSFLRAYAGASALRVFGEARAGIRYSNYYGSESPLQSTYSMKVNDLTYGAGAGVAYFINEHTGLELMLNYNNTAGTHPLYYHIYHLSLQAGFVFYLPARK